MNVCAILIPYDSGRFCERMGNGPSHLLENAVVPVLTRLGHGVRSETLNLGETFTAEIGTAFKLSGMLAETVRLCRRTGWFPVVLSGNCNAAVGTVSGCGCDTTGVVWFDAHGESTTPETTTSGFLDGMGISILTGQCWSKLARSIPGFVPVPGERIALVGARDLEPDELALLERAAVQRVSDASDLRGAITRIAAKTTGFYMHFDLDVLDPQAAAANQWPVPDGCSVSDLVDCVESVVQHSSLNAVGFASFDPEADRDGNAVEAARACVEALFSSSCCVSI